MIKLIRQVSESSETLELTVVHKIETEETLEEEENKDEVDAGVNEMKDWLCFLCRFKKNSWYNMTQILRAQVFTSLT